jgi:hypothetical protein
MGTRGGERVSLQLNRAKFPGQPCVKIFNLALEKIFSAILFCDVQNSIASIVILN